MEVFNINLCCFITIDR